MKKPNFMCLGSPKCGTTTLYDILKEHSDIFLTPCKEPHFFDIKNNYKKGYQWYLSEYYSAVSNQKVVGEFTPSYFVSPNVSKRILEKIGSDMKFLIVLRNPVDRAYSQYLHAKRDLLEDLDFEESLACEKTRLKTARNENNDISYIWFSYIHGGLYYSLLTEFLKKFDKNKFKIVIFEEEFIHDRAKLVSNILSFLDIEDEKLLVDIKSNQAASTRFPFIKKLLRGDSKVRKIMKHLIKSKSLRSKIGYTLQKISNKKVEKEGLSADVRDRIMEKYFMEDISNLESLLGRDLSIWYEK